MKKLLLFILLVAFPLLAMAQAIMLALIKMVNQMEVLGTIKMEKFLKTYKR